MSERRRPASSGRGRPYAHPSDDSGDETNPYRETVAPAPDADAGARITGGSDEAAAERPARPRRPRRPAAEGAADAAPANAAPANAVPANAVPAEAQPTASTPAPSSDAAVDATPARAPRRGRPRRASVEGDGAGAPGASDAAPSLFDRTEVEPPAPAEPREPRDDREPRHGGEAGGPTGGAERPDRQERPDRPDRGDPRRPRHERPDRGADRPAERSAERFDRGPRGDRPAHPHQRQERQDRGERGEWAGGGGRRGRRNRGRGPHGGGGAPNQPHQPHQSQQAQAPRRDQPGAPPAPIVVTGEARGWFDLGRDGGYVRRPEASYLAESGDAFVPQHLVRQHGLRRGDLIEVGIGRDHRGRTVAAEVRTINGVDPTAGMPRPEFQALQASYPDRKLMLETGRPARGAELTRRAIDLIAPIGYGQRALIVAPARAGKTTLLHAITEGVATNHPEAALLILLVDERPEEVSEAQSWGVGEVISSSFDQPAQRHVEVTDIVLQRAHRLVELGRDVVIVLDSLTRMARAHNTAERGTGRTLSGGLDAQAMAKPKAFFGSARAVAPGAGGGSLTIIATALVETGSRMDDVIFEEFKGTGNCEIKLDRSLAEKRIFPAIDIATSGTRREEKLFKPEQLDAVYALRRGLSQMPPQAAMEWLIKRIAATPSNEGLLAGLIRD